jgi:hypothetical protein
VERVPEVTRARVDLLEDLARGAIGGVIIWAQDDESNYFIVPVGQVVLGDEGINAKGGSA